MKILKTSTHNLVESIIDASKDNKTETWQAILEKLGLEDEEDPFYEMYKAEAISEEKLNIAYKQEEDEWFWNELVSEQTRNDILNRK